MRLIEIVIYFVVLTLLYLGRLKLKAFFTGRTLTDKIDHEDARADERVCRNSRYCVPGTSCGLDDIDVDGNRDCCTSLEK